MYEPIGQLETDDVGAVGAHHGAAEAAVVFPPENDFKLSISSTDQKRIP
jgi:hypothetical protein